MADSVFKNVETMEIHRCEFVLKDLPELIVVLQLLPKITTNPQRLSFMELLHCSGPFHFTKVPSTCAEVDQNGGNPSTNLLRKSFGNRLGGMPNDVWFPGPSLLIIGSQFKGTVDQRNEHSRKGFSPNQCVKFMIPRRLED